MSNQTVAEGHSGTLKWVFEENDLLEKPYKIFNTDESGINMDLRQAKLMVLCGSKQTHSQSIISRAWSYNH